MTVTTGRSLLEAWKLWMFALLGGLRALTAWPWRWSCGRRHRGDGHRVARVARGTLSRPWQLDLNMSREGG